MQSDEEVDPQRAELAERLDRLWMKPTALTFGQSDDKGALARFQVIGPIGCGSFGVVFRARDPQLDRDVAIKVARPEVVVDRQARRRFESEAALAAALHHPGIVEILQADLQCSVPYIVSPYIAGPNLKEWLNENHQQLTPKQISRFLIKLTEAVDFAHSKGVLHRDLKPENILLEPTQQSADSRDSLSLDDFIPRVTDFGFAVSLREGLNDTRSSMLLGTPLYMAPEQMHRGLGKTDRPTDVYALGTILFEMLTGKLPFAGNSYFELAERLRDDPTPALSGRPDVPRDLAAICDKAREREPMDRYQSASLLVADLKRFEQDEAVAASPQSLRNRFARWTRQPARAENAGRFAMAFGVFMSVWIGIINLLWTVSAAHPPDPAEARLHSALSIIAVLAPMALIGWFTYRRSRVAVWIGLLHGIVNLPVAILGAANNPTLFREMYTGRPDVAKMIYGIFLLGFVIQVVYFGIAAIGEIGKSRRASSDS